MAIWLFVEPQRLWLVPLWGKYVCVQLGRSHILRLWLVAGTNKDSTHLYIHCIVMRERRDSTNAHNAYGTNGLRNIGVNVINTRIDFLNPSVSQARQLPYIATQHRGAKLVWAEKITYTNEGGPNIHYGSPSTL